MTFTAPASMPGINVYCDESCHLENDGHGLMVLGAVWCPTARVRSIARGLRGIKVRHGLSSNFEIKWSKVSPAGLAFYLDVVTYFFDCPDLHFRVLVARNKDRLRHQLYNQDHDTWYFKMYFTLLTQILKPDAAHRIYLDIKDTRSSVKVRKLHEVLCNSRYDFRSEVVARVQTVRSHEVEQIQFADLLGGAVSYVNRGLHGNAGKNAVVALIRERSHYDLERNTLLREGKFNIFHWFPTPP